jgi:hypothetical protein
MNPHRQKLCLSMIVKNEAAVIRRCLGAVLPLIDYWVIVDTGSEDGTQEAIKEFMRSVPGELHERPWVDFGHNRTEALELAKPHAEYILVIDADDTLVIDPSFVMPKLAKDSYSVIIEHPPYSYHRTQLLRNSSGWRFAGVTHEIPVRDAPIATGELLSGIRIRRGDDGARRKQPDVFRREAAFLESALLTEKDRFLLARYRFYLAQSYRDCGEIHKAIENYLIRASLGFWDEEIFVSLLEAAKLQGQLGHSIDEVLTTLGKAADACPRRAEALHAASRLCRLHNRFAQGYEFARRGMNIPLPDGGLFVEAWVYEYGLLDEFAISAYCVGRYDDCLAACECLLQERKIPAESRHRIERKARFARKKLSSRRMGQGNEPAALHAGAPELSLVRMSWT